MLRAVAVFVLGLTSLLATTVAQQPPANTSPAQPTVGILGRPSPPQPTQRQGVEYFVGTWSFTWTGRESPLTAGPRTGTAIYTRVGTSNVVEARIEGKSEAAGAYQETATLTWQEAQKAVTLQERLSMGGGITLVSTGDWSTPIAIHLESAPVVVKGQSLRLRRAIGIVSAVSFTVNEELSTDGGPFVRLGGGVFKKSP